jgi:sugar/nucleoside kinase (ribokinase family)
VVPSLSGDRTLFAYRGANATVLSEELPLKAIEDSDFIYVTSLSKASSIHLPQLVQAASKFKVPVAVNPGISQLKLGSGFLRESLSGIEILITNYEEAQQLMTSLSAQKEISDDKNLEMTGSLMQEAFSLKSYFERILSLGPKIVIVTNGREGVYVATESGVYFHPVHPVPVVNTLGAGDAFGSSFSGFYYQGFGVEKAILAGIINSASVVGFSDAKTGLLSRDELIRQVEAFSSSLPKQRGFSEL